MGTASDFIYHLRDTIVLLGGPANICDLLSAPGAIRKDDVDALRRFNCGLIDTTKQKLAGINKITVVVGGEDG